MTFFHRYFSVRSMKASDPHIMAVACLLLATKSEDQTRAVKDIVRNSWAARYGPRHVSACLACLLLNTSTQQAMLLGMHVKHNQNQPHSAARQQSVPGQ